MKHGTFKVILIKGMKKYRTMTMRCGSQEGMTEEEARSYCKDKWPEYKIRVEAV